MDRHPFEGRSDVYFCEPGSSTRDFNQLDCLVYVVVPERKFVEGDQAIDAWDCGIMR